MALVDVRERLVGLRGWSTRQRTAPRRRLPVPVAWALAGGAGAAAGLLVVEALVLTFWAADARSATGAGGALRVGGSFWLLGHGVPLTVREGRIGIMPLGLTALFLVGAARAGAAVARSATVGRDTSPAWVRGAGLGLPYGAVALLLSRVLAGGGVLSSPVLAFAFPALLSGAAAAAGASRAARAEARAAGRTLAPPLLVRACPGWARDAAPAAAAAACFLLAAGALIAATFVLLHWRAVADVASSLTSGVVGGAGMFLAGALVAPNVAVWAAAACIGPGFSVGAGTTVSPLRVELGDVPAFPILAALPGNGPVPLYITVAMFAVPACAGVVAGLFLLRRANPPRGLPGATADGLVAGLGAGLLVLVATALSGGGIGPGRLAITGPSSWQAGLLVAGEVSVVAVAVAVTGTKLRRRRPTTGSAVALAASTLAASGNGLVSVRRLPVPVGAVSIERQAGLDVEPTFDDSGDADAEMEARAQPARRPRFRRRHDTASGAGRLSQPRVRRGRRRGGG